MSKRTTGRSRREPHASITVRFAVVAASILIVFAVTWATYIASTTTVQIVEVAGSFHSSVNEIVDMSGVQSGDTLFAADPNLIAARVKRHRWVEEVAVTRWPTGTLSIAVEERVPVALVIERTGVPGYYLDRHGVILPVDTLARYDVPLLRGYDRIGERALRVDDDDTIELLGVLATLRPEADDLISDVIRDEQAGFEIVTVPFRDKRGIRVRLGRGDYERKLATLVAFWSQAVVGRSSKSIEWIDLRFEGQVVTKET
jgi:cell division protein FtsQ